MLLQPPPSCCCRSAAKLPPSTPPSCRCCHHRRCCHHAAAKLSLPSFHCHCRCYVALLPLLLLPPPCYGLCRCIIFAVASLTHCRCVAVAPSTACAVALPLHCSLPPLLIDCCIFLHGACCSRNGKGWVRSQSDDNKKNHQILWW
jgi:hypothetical protein